MVDVLVSVRLFPFPGFLQATGMDLHRLLDNRLDFRESRNNPGWEIDRGPENALKKCVRSVESQILTQQDPGYRNL